MPAPPCGSYGDIDGDGSVTTLDVTIVLDYVTNKTNPKYALTQDQLIRADVNGDGDVNMLDVTLLFDYVAGKIATFPVCEQVLHPVSISSVPAGADISVD